jgi:hypothetical protein
MNKTISCLISAALFSTSLTGSVNAGAAGGGVAVFGGGEPASSKQLPAGDFRKSLESLPAEDHGRAVQWLQSIEFTSQDLDYMKLDSQGGVYYADRYTVDKSHGAMSGKAGTPGAQALTAKSVLKLHSNPGAHKTIFVDFTGGVIKDTAWNRTAGVTSWNARPYDSDNKPKSFSEAEIAAMAEIWRRISEDYAPFNVDVTTEAPDTMGANTNWIMVTNSMAGNNKSLPEPDSGSVSYMNVSGFSHTGYYSPALVYYNNLASPGSIAEASSHAVGHLYGLSHDSNPGSGVRGNGSVSWSPIMGLGPFSNVTQWSKGGYDGAVNPQNDIGILVGALDMRRDDHDDSYFDTGTSLQVDPLGRVTASTPATDPDNSQSANKGVIEAQDDVDIFVFKSGAGMVDLTVSPAWLVFDSGHPRGANLDVQLTLFDANGKKLAKNNPLNETDSSIKTQVSAGRYVLEVAAAGNAAGSHTAYGSLGQYFINGSIPVPESAAKVAVSVR